MLKAVSKACAAALLCSCSPLSKQLTSVPRPGSSRPQNPENSNSTKNPVDSTSEIVTPDEARALGFPYINILVNGATIEALNNNPESEETLPVDMVFNDNRFYKGVEFSIHGSGSRHFPKISYKLKFPKEIKPDVSFLGGNGPEKRRSFVLMSHYQDTSFLRNKIAYDALRSMGIPAPRESFVALAFNSQFQGFYGILEKVDEDYLKQNKLNPSGMLLKAEGGLAAPWREKSAGPLAGLEVKSEGGDPLAEMADFWHTLQNTPLDDASFKASVEPKLNIETFYNWQIINTLTNNVDGYVNNYFLYKDLSAPAGSPGAAFQVLNWDFDAGWGQLWNGKRLNPEQNGWHSLPGQIVGLDTPDGDGWYGWDGFSARLFHIPSYCNTYITRYKAALAGPLSADQLIAEVDLWAPKLAAGVAADFKRWGRSQNYQEEVEYFKYSIRKRQEHMLKEIDGACERGTKLNNTPISPRFPFSNSH